MQKFLTDPGNIAVIGGGALQVGASIASAISGIIVVLVALGLIGRIAGFFG